MEGGTVNGMHRKMCDKRKQSCVAVWKCQDYKELPDAVRILRTSMNLQRIARICKGGRI